MKTVFDNSQCVHVWAQQTQDEGRSSNGNLFFRGPVIYSYGEHFPLACFVDDKRVLVNSDRYSVSTSKHQGYVGYAINHKTRLHVSTRILKAFIWDRTFNDRAQRAAIEEARAAYQSAIERAAKRRMNKKKGEELSQGAMEIQGLINLFEFFNVPAPEEIITLKDTLYLGDVGALIQAHKDKIEKERLEREQKEKEFQERIETAMRSHWLNNLPMSETGLSPYQSKRVFMRVNGDEIETSKGARFPVKHAKLAFKVIREKREAHSDYIRARDTVPGYSGFHLGNFTIDEIDAQGNVKAGCHWVEWPEIEHCARVLGIYP